MGASLRVALAWIIKGIQKSFKKISLSTNFESAIPGVGSRTIEVLFAASRVECSLFKRHAWRRHSLYSAARTPLP